jgi:histidinol dehydrogenase
MKIYNSPPASTWTQLCKRPEMENGSLDAIIADVFKRVQSEGDNALIDYTKRFDDVTIPRVTVDADLLDTWADRVPSKLKAAIDIAYANITTFHKAQQTNLQSVYVETQPGVRCWREAKPIERIGLYIPGGSAPLFSTVLMLGVPAQLAGCSEVILCTPPQPDGSINPAICYAARLVGVTTVFQVGGSQAIAALAVGTQTIAKVDKIFGPGNQYVTAAKLYAGRYGVAIDMPAGPSEVMVVADFSARADFVAADLLSQAEHGADSQVVLVATDASIATSVNKELDKQLATLPRRDTAKAALASSFCIVVDGISRAVQFANSYAPEHLILSVEDAETVAKQVQNTGSVFLGNYTPESAGDYASGTNHTLPTNGWSRSNSGVSLESFCKYITFQSITEAGAKGLAPTVMTMADAEGLQAHKRAMEIRL